jgi:5-methylcytosine-specific restriction endonuclease McrA
MVLTKKQRQEVWNKSGGKCWYCGVELPTTGWHADHFLPVERISKYVRDERPNGLYSHKFKPTGEVAYPERETIDNYVPSCASCNIWKSKMYVETFRQTLEDLSRTVKNYNSVRVAERYGLVEIHENPIEFWFEKNRKEIK